ncbi:unnamed protein product [Cunninghamella blakesleeana]
MGEKVYLDIAIGDIKKHQEESQRYEKAKEWVKKWSTTYGLESDNLEKLNEQDKETIRDILSNDPIAQEEKWLINPPTPLGGGRMVFELNDKECPKTTNNFISICQGNVIGKASKKQLHYKSTKLFRLIPHFIIQGGDVTKNDGSGGDSIYNGKFNDEKNGLKPFNKKGILAMANSGKNSNTSQFFITLNEPNESNSKQLSKINGKYVVFGQVIEGLEILDQFNHVPVKGESPTIDITITDSGLIVN